MDAIKWQGNALLLLDQTKLPVTEYWLRYTDFRQVATAIKTMVVRGAPAIGVAAAYAYVLAAREFSGLSGQALSLQMTQAKAVLAASRPTAVNLFWALDRMAACFAAHSDSPSVLKALEDEAVAIHREDVEMNLQIGRFGAALVPEQARILTHCNAGALATGGYGTALGVVRAAYAQGKVAMVYADETRPLLQGSRLTAYELVRDHIPATLIADNVRDHIPATLIADNMAASLMRAGKIDMVVLGCDRMAANGDFANKIGTYSVAVNARFHGIPFYTALPSSTIDLSIEDGSGIALPSSTIDLRLPDGNHIPIEERSGEEMTHLSGVQTAPLGVGTYNPAFDVTPHELLTGIITEKGVVYPPFRENLQALFG